MTEAFWDEFDPEPDPAPAGVCDRCHMARSLTGACECE